MATLQACLPGHSRLTMATLQLACAQLVEVDKRGAPAHRTIVPEMSLSSTFGFPLRLSVDQRHTTSALRVSSEVFSSISCSPLRVILDNKRCTSAFSIFHEVCSFTSFFPPRRLCERIAIVKNSLEADTESDEVGRRELLTGIAVLAATISMSSDSALAAKVPSGFSAVLDSADGYAFVYPFGWQEVAVRGQDVAFKDVIEPLESVSVSIIKTDKASLEEFGSPEDVAKALVERVLSSPTQKTVLKDVKARVTDGKTYYQFEFMAEAKNFTRHGLGIVAVSGGKFFTLTTGANERRWGKIEDKLRQVVDSFTTL